MSSPSFFQRCRLEALTEAGCELQLGWEMSVFFFWAGCPTHKNGCSRCSLWCCFSWCSLVANPGTSFGMRKPSYIVVVLQDLLDVDQYDLEAHLMTHNHACSFPILEFLWLSSHQKKLPPFTTPHHSSAKYFNLPEALKGYTLKPGCSCS